LPRSELLPTWATKSEVKKSRKIAEGLFKRSAEWKPSFFLTLREQDPSCFYRYKRTKRGADIHFSQQKLAALMANCKNSQLFVLLHERQPHINLL
jgi:hypothetical protein